MTVRRPSPNVAPPTPKGLISGSLKSSLIAVRVFVLPAAATACGPASQVAQGVLDAEAVLVARGLLQEGLELPDRLVGAVRLLVEQAEVVVGVRKVAAALIYGLAEGRLRAAVVLLLRERDAEAVEGFGVAPLVLLYRLAEGVGGLRPVPLVVEDRADLVEGVRVVAAVAGGSVAVGRERLLPLALLLECEAEVVLRHGVVAPLLLDGRAELFGCRRELTLQHEHAAQAVVRAGETGLQLDGAAQVAYGRVVAAYGEEVGAVLVELGGGLGLLNRRAARRRAAGPERAAQRVFR